MNRTTAVLMGVLLAAGITGCNSRDKDEVAKKPDGTETFKYDASTEAPKAGAAPAEPPKAEQSQPVQATKPAAGKHENGFKYKPNPKYFPNTKAKAGD